MRRATEAGGAHAFCLPSPTGFSAAMKSCKPPSACAGRVFLGLVLLLLAGILLLLALPGALLHVQYWNFWIASVAIVIASVGWMLLSSARRRRAGGNEGVLAGWEVPAALAAILLAALWGFWSFKLAELDRWETSDEAERVKAAAWHESLDAYQGGMPWEGLRDRLSAQGFRVRCTTLGPDQGMAAGDTHACTIVAQSTWGIPARKLYFLFGPEGLRQIRIDYAKEQWPAVRNWFDGLSGTTTGPYGRDSAGNVIIGKMLASGQVLTAEPGQMPDLMVLWQARSWLQQTICRGNDNDPRREVICNPSRP